MNDSDLHLVTRTIIPLVKGMCHRPEELRVREGKSTEPGFDHMVFLDPAMCDVGVVNGGGSRTLNGLKGIVSAAFRRYKIKATMRIEETYRGDLQPRSAFKENPNFERDSGFSKIFAHVLNIVFDEVPEIIRTDDLIDRKDGSLYTRIIVDAHPAMVNALADAFFPFGIRQGRRLKIVTPKTQTTYDSQTTQRTRPVPR
jgi:predicted RNA-binding protein YlqC (UPF0109 family)